MYVAILSKCIKNYNFITSGWINVTSSENTNKISSVYKLIIILSPNSNSTIAFPSLLLYILTLFGVLNLSKVTNNFLTSSTELSLERRALIAPDFLIEELNGKLKDEEFRIQLLNKKMEILWPRVKEEK